MFLAEIIMVDQADDAPEQSESKQKVLTEHELAIHAAITGKKPVIEVVAYMRAAGLVGCVIPESGKRMRRALSSRQRQRKVFVWIRNVSGFARKQFDQAKLRLAS